MTLEEYLQSHDINKASIEKFDLRQNGDELVIPVTDHAGKVLYNKYRNLKFNKNNSESNKFRFETGSKVTLFNSTALKGDKDYVVLTEGEIDCIRLDQEDVSAVSGTAGVSTFKDEWIKEFEGKTVFICFDNDKPGQDNGLKVAKKLSVAGINNKIIKLPDDCKDVSEFFVKGHTKEEFSGLCKKTKEFKNQKVHEEILGFTTDISDPLRISLARENLTYTITSLKEYRADISVYFDNKLRNRELLLLTSGKSRATFAKSCRDTSDEVKDLIKNHLFEIIEVIDELDRRQLQTKDEEEEDNLTENEIATSKKILKSPTLLFDVLSIIKKCGVIGEEENALTHYLTFSSRILDDPLSIVVKGESAAGKSYVPSIVMHLMPTIAYIDLTDATPQSFYYAPKDHFAHKIIVVFEKHGSEKADYSIRSLQSEKKLKIQVPIKDPDTGQFVTQELTVDGPVGFITTTTDARIHNENETRNLSLYPDESVAQTERTFEITDAKYRGVAALSKDEIKKWQNVQKVLKPYKVLIPFVEELRNTFPKEPIRVRRDYGKLLALISVITLVHQEQRPKEKIGQEEYLSATLVDFYITKVLFEGIFQKTIYEIPPKSQLLIDTAKDLTSDLESVTVRELADKLSWDYDTAKKWFNPAFQKGYFRVIEEHKGSKAATYKPTSKKVYNRQILPEVEALFEKNSSWLGETPIYNPITGEIHKFQELEITTDIPTPKEDEYIKDQKSLA